MPIPPVDLDPVKAYLDRMRGFNFVGEMGHVVKEGMQHLEAVVAEVEELRNDLTETINSYESHFSGPPKPIHETPCTGLLGE